MTTLAVLLGVSGQARAQSVASDTTPAADTTLRAALHEVVRRTSPQLAARRAALTAAEARSRAAGYAAPAVLSAEVEEVPLSGGPGDVGSLRLDVQRELLTGGRRGASRALAASEVARAGADLYAAERRVLADADRRLVQAAGWAAIARRLAAEDSLLVDAENGIRARFVVGDARYVDVLRLRTERLRVGSERATALTEARAGRRSLEALLTKDDTGAMRVLTRIDSTLVAAPAVAAAELLAGALPPAPDVDSLVAASGALRLADADLARAEAARRLILADQRPAVAVSVGAQRFATDDGRTTIGPTVGASISLPFTARRANRTVAQATAHDVTAAHAERRATLTEVRADLAVARDRYEAARFRVAAYDAALLTAARQEREGALASYRTGALSLVELLDFERALARAEIDRLRGRIEAADALADLLGGATETPAPTSTNLRDTGGDR